MCVDEKVLRACMLPSIEPAQTVTQVEPSGEKALVGVRSG